MEYAPVSRTLALLALSACLSTALEAGPKLIEVPLSGREVRKEVANWGVEIVAVKPDSMVLAVPPDVLKLPKVYRALSDVPGTKVLSEDVDPLFARIAAKDDMGAYHNYDEIVAELKGHVTSHPDLCEYRSIGTSVEGREMPALRIRGGSASPYGRPVFLFMGAHHAREWISVEVPLAIARRLVTGYDTEPEIKEIVDSRTIWVVPVVNPDGHSFSQTNQRYWRKNRRANGDGSFGVDPNRNYGYKWGTTGASASPWSDTFRGPEAFSEPETQAIRDFARAEGLTSSVSYHSYGGLILFPWSYDYDHHPDEDKFRGIGDKMAVKNSYRNQQSSDLYPSSGDTDDWLNSDNGSLSYTIELGDEFIPDESEIPSITGPNVEAALVLLKEGADAFPLVLHQAPADQTGTGPFPVTAEVDSSHNPTFGVTSVTLVVEGTEGVTEIPMTQDPQDPKIYRGEIPAVSQAGPVKYYFGMAGAAERKGRTPRVGTFSFQAGTGIPPTASHGFFRLNEF